MTRPTPDTIIGIGFAITVWALFVWTFGGLT